MVNFKHILNKFGVLQELSASQANIKFGVEIEMLVPTEWLGSDENRGEYSVNALWYSLEKNINDSELLRGWEPHYDSSIQDTKYNQHKTIKRIQKKNSMKKFNPLLAKVDQMMKQKWTLQDLLGNEKAMELCKVVSKTKIQDVMQFSNPPEKEIPDANTLFGAFQTNKNMRITTDSIISFDERESNYARRISIEFVYKYLDIMFVDVFQDIANYINDRPDGILGKVNWNIMQNFKKDVSWSSEKEMKYADFVPDKNHVKFFEYCERNRSAYRKMTSDYEWSYRKELQKPENQPRPGIEIVSPPLAYNVSNVRNVQKLLTQLKKMGCEVNGSTGLHVHISTTHEYSNFNLLAMALWIHDNEREFYLLFGDTRKNSPYATSVKRSIEEAAYVFLDELIETLNQESYDVDNPPEKELERQFKKFIKSNPTRTVTGAESRNYGLNFDALRTHGTIEFRYGAGTFNQEIFYQYLLLCVECFYNIFVNKIEYKGMVITELNPESKYRIEYGGQTYGIDT